MKIVMKKDPKVYNWLDNLQEGTNNLFNKEQTELLEDDDEEDDEIDQEMMKSIFLPVN